MNTIHHHDWGHRWAGGNFADTIYGGIPGILSLEFLLLAADISSFKNLALLLRAVQVWCTVFLGDEDNPLDSNPMHTYMRTRVIREKLIHFKLNR